MPKPTKLAGCVDVKAANGTTYHVAPFKAYGSAYGAFANTTPTGTNPDYPIVQDKMIDGRSLSTIGITPPIKWPSSEHAFHAQKLIQYIIDNPTKTKEIAIMKQMIQEIATSPGNPFLPRDHFDPIVNKHLSSLRFKSKLEFDLACKANFYPSKTPLVDGVDIDPSTKIPPHTNGLPYTYGYMKFVMQMKMEQHPDLKEAAMEFAKQGIIPVEISQHDQVWASGIDGKGLNYLGIIISELGKEFVEAEAKAKGVNPPKIEDPHNVYNQLKGNEQLAAKINGQKGGANTTMMDYANGTYSMPNQVPLAPKVPSPPPAAPKGLPGKTATAKERVLEKIAKATYVYVDYDKNDFTKKVLKVQFNTAADARKFAKSLENKDDIFPPTSGDGTVVILGEIRVQDFFKDKNLETHDHKPMMNALWDEQAKKPAPPLSPPAVLPALAPPVVVPGTSGTTPLPKAKVSAMIQGVGGFAEYKGINNKIIYGNSAIQGVLAKQMLSQLDPKDGWEKSPITELKTPLHQQTGSIVISSKSFESAFGDGECRISKEELKRLSDTAKIVTNSKMITPELFLKIQNELIDKINPQEKRTLSDIIPEQDKDKWLKDYKNLGYNSKEELEQILNTPLILLSSNICHSQEVHFFVEQQLSEDTPPKALNKLRNADLDKETPCVVLSIPGINLAYSGLPITKESDGDLTVGTMSAKQLATNMWESVLSSAISQNCRNLAMPAIGLGEFAGGYGDEMSKIYFSSLFELLKSEKYSGKFDNVLFNPIQYGQNFQDELKKHQDALQKSNCNVQAVSCDVKMLAVEFAKKQQKCALLNPSDMDVVLGKYDVGEYYKSGHYVGEEDIAATSTAAIGSTGISNVYRDPNRITSASKSIVAAKVQIPTSPSEPPPEPPDETAPEPSALTIPPKLPGDTPTEAKGGLLDGLSEKYKKLEIDDIKKNVREYFERKIEAGDTNLKNIAYFDGSSDKTIIGEIRSTEGSTKNKILANIKQDSIECPIIPARFGKSDVSDVQQQIFVSFLEMKSIEMMADQDNMMTVDVNKFSPKALNKLLELLQKNDPKIFVDLRLPEPENCTYGNGKKYTQEEYNTAKQQIDNYKKFLVNPIEKKESSEDASSTSSLRKIK